MILPVLLIALGYIGSLEGAATCERKWKKVGCFHDNIFPERPLKYELLNRRDPYNHNFDGHMINWQDYPGTLYSLYCKCAELTEAKGYTHFGLQFYGECWSGPSANERYNMYGKSERCIGVDYDACDDSAETDCIGKDKTNYIYQLVAKNESKLIDGGYSEWTKWTECTKTCGGGVRVRTRSCNNPSPSSGGKDCTSLGESEELEVCNNQACRKPCKRAIDLGIIMDASTSVKRSNYNKVKIFIKELSEDFEISKTGTHFGILHYSGSAKLDFTMRDSQYYNRINLKAKIDSIPYSYGSTRTDRALRLADQQFFCSGCNPAGRPQVLLVITDGNTNKGSEDLGTASQGMKDKGVTVLSLGIGPQISKAELELIASVADDRHVFQSSSFDELKEKLNTILETACAAVR
ncbi:coadhesin-like [Rhopilema esculentum]|uniref:coadhesin-like n=1 Tax=Rhopilema esculentum TaxID=499914 RepID=UPI0031DD27C9